MGICVSCRRRERKAPEKRSAPGAGQPAKGAAAAELLPRRFDRLPMMANSMSNIKMTNPIKGIVSRRRRRYVKDGFNLDLAYITDRLIAMGFPAEKLEGVYRNHIDEVYRFLETMHKDHYKIYNLCSERSYDKNKFHDRVERYAFEDHTPPNIEIIQPFCEDVHNWLSADSKNVAAVHCKAGKGRTGMVGYCRLSVRRDVALVKYMVRVLRGELHHPAVLTALRLRAPNDYLGAPKCTMVCCYLLYSRQKATADEALKFYGTKRAHDNKGVTIPSQRRYVEYYAWLLQSGIPYVPCKLHIRELLMSPPPTHAAAHHATPELLITQARPFFKAPIGCVDVRRTAMCVRVQLDQCTPLVGDVRLDVFHKHKMKRKEKLFHFWFNTFFLTAGASAQQVQPLPDSPNLETYKLTLNKWQLDDAHKDKQHKYYSQDFKVELIVQKMPDTSTFAGCARSASPPPSSASSCSSASASERSDTHWDSGEGPIPYSRLSEDHSLNLNLPCDTPADTTRGKDAPIDSTGAVDRSVGNDAAMGRNSGAVLDGRNIRFSDNARLGALLDGADNTDVKPGLLMEGEKDFQDSGLLDVGVTDSIVDGYLNVMGVARSSHLSDSHVAGNDGSVKNKVGIYCPYHAVTSYHLPGGIEVQAPIENHTKNTPVFKGSRNKNTTKCTCETVSNPILNPIYISDKATLNPIYTRPYKSSSEVPTANPLYCSKAPESRESPEPMDYANDVFSSAPTSARESPVEDKKRAEDKTKPRLSLGDMRASWREFSGKFASDSRRKKDDS